MFLLLKKRTNLDRESLRNSKKIPEFSKFQLFAIFLDDLEVYTTTGVFLILRNSWILMPPARFSGSKSSILDALFIWGVPGFLPNGGEE